MRLAWVLAVCACGEPTAVPPDADPAAACDPALGAATLVDSFIWGPVTGISTTVPMSPTAAGDLLVVTIVNTYGAIRMTGGQPRLQIGLGGSCSTFSTMWSVGNLVDGVTSFNIEMTGPQTTFTAFVHRFRGLRAEAGAELTYAYGHSYYGDGAAPKVAACPGSAVVSIITSCGHLAPGPNPPFTGLDVVARSSTAAYAPDTFGYYGAEWATATADTATAVFQ
jgi:hypothetical protein